VRESSPTPGFDEALLALPSGETRRLSRSEFDALPLPERVRAILSKELKFFRGGQEVPMKDALADR
jgi:hypothetical protein